MTRRALPVFLFFCAVSILSFAQERRDRPLAPGKAALVDAAIQREMHRQQLVGVSLGVIQDGEIVYLQGYGHADREQGTPTTVDTVFNWASNSKPLAAVAAMQLVEQGRLDLDANVRDYVPEFPDKNVLITTRHLLAHQSGIPHYSNGRIVPTDRTYSTELPWLNPVCGLDKFNQSSLLFEPGEKASYSSYAYILLSAVIQGAGKENFTDQVEKRIRTPLDLSSLQLDLEYAAQPHWTKGYIRNGDKQIVAASDEANYWKLGAGGYKSNIRDFARWATAIINRRLVSEPIERQMWTNQKLKNDAPTTWGLGFTVEQQNGTLKVSHNGKQNETTTRMVLYPQVKHGIVVMCNCAYCDVAAVSTAVYQVLNSNVPHAK